MAAVTAVLQGKRDANALLADLSALYAQETALNGYIDALLVVLNHESQSAITLLNATHSLFAQHNASYTYGDTLAGVANVAGLLGDNKTQLAACRASIAALRQISNEKALNALRNMLYRLAALHFHAQQYEDALPLLEELVAIDERTGHAELEAHRKALEVVRGLARMG